MASVYSDFWHDFIPEWSASAAAHWLFNVAIILLAGLLAQQILRYVAHIIEKRLASRSKGTQKERISRAKSLGAVLTTSLSLVIWLVVLLALLGKFGVDAGPFLASAGILGLAISFGSQDLVRDALAGIFFLLENQFNSGDVIQFNDKKGKVVSMSLRTITVRDEQDVLHVIRNSQIGILSRFPDKENNDSTSN
jgi:small conductance mechanosensitive channel